MRVTVIQTGGFAGLTFTRTVESKNLSVMEEADLKKLVNDSGILANIGQTASGPGQPDRFSYTITVEDGDGTYSVSVSEEKRAPELRALISFVEDRAERK